MSDPRETKPMSAFDFLRIALAEGRGIDRDNAEAMKPIDIEAKGIANTIDRELEPFVTRAALDEALKNVPTAIATAAIVTVVADKVAEALTARGEHLSPERVREIAEAAVLGALPDGVNEARVKELIREHAPTPPAPVTTTVTKVTSSTWLAGLALILALVALFLALTGSNQPSSSVPTAPAPAATATAPTPAPSPAPGPVLVDLDPNFVSRCTTNVAQRDGTFTIECDDGQYYNCQQVIAPAVAKQCKVVPHPVCATMTDGSTTKIELCP